MEIVHIDFVLAVPNKLNTTTNLLMFLSVPFYFDSILSASRAFGLARNEPLCAMIPRILASHLSHKHPMTVVDVATPDFLHLMERNDD